ncbi:MAG: hypothetical protein KIT10_04745 [Flavobacteriales bacterium]|nr:hypothetical protein [Flavobacteriales bacterium]
MLRSNLIAVLVISVAQVLPAMDRIPLDEVLRRGAISLQVTAADEATGGDVKAVVRNTSGATVRTTIPAGWVFTSIDEGVQDLLVVREEVLDLSAGASRTVVCRALCTQGPLRGPQEGEPYRPGQWAAPGLVAVATAIAAGDYPDDLAQSAVWVMSDGYSIAGMGSLDSSATDTLRLVVSRLSGQPPPRYSMRFRAEEDRMCSGVPEAIQRALVVDAPAGVRFHAIVLDRRGRVMHVLHRDTMLDRGVHRLVFEVPVLDWPPGPYAIHAWTQQDAGVHRLPFTL